MQKQRAGILGASGLVGQHYVRLLQNHPFFEIAFLAASSTSAGKTYGAVLAEKQRPLDGIPSAVLSMRVHAIEDLPAAQAQCDFVFSAVDGSVARIHEPLYAAADLPVISNASAFRMEPDVPLLIPEVNPEHLEILPIQKKNRGWGRGFILAKPNCSIQSYLTPLYALHQKFGLKKIIVSTMQAISGAGYPGVSSLDIVDNVIPYIAGEEEKSENEPLKILGRIADGKIAPLSGLSISAHCNRVPVLDGHTACVSAQFERKPPRDEILAAWRAFQGVPQQLRLPSAPQMPILYREENDRPQPRLDRHAANGMAITVGRLRDCSALDIRFAALSHNALRGAAGGGLLNAELLYCKGLL